MIPAGRASVPATFERQALHLAERPYILKIFRCRTIMA